MATAPHPAPPVDMNELNQALALCFGPTSTPQQRSAADRWLQDFQRTPAAWQVAEAILAETAAVDPNVLFFAATTLHAKICNDFGQLAPESQIPLRGAISTHLMRWMLTPGASRPVLKRLCLCAAALAVQMTWAEVLHAIPAMIEQASPEHRLTVTKMAMELLGYLPEECNSLWVNVEDDKRDAFQAVLDGRAAQVLVFVSQTSSREDVRTDAECLESILLCLMCWLRFCSIPPAVLAEQPLIPCALDLLALPQVPGPLLEAAVDAMVELFRRYDASPANAALTQLVVPKVMALVPRYMEAMQAGPVAEDTCRGLVRVFTEMGESYMQLILAPEQNGVLVTQVILQCTSYPVFGIAKITLFFWYRLVKVWHHLEDEATKAQLHATFSPIMAALVGQCFRLLRCPDDIDDYSRDQRDEFAVQRQQVCDTLYDCCVFLGPAAVMEQLWATVGQEFHLLEQAPTRWQGIEACLYALFDDRIEREMVVSECDPYFKNMVPLLLSLESRPVWAAGVRLQYSACQVFGALSGFFRRQGMEPDLLSQVFTFLYNHMLRPDTTKAAAVAIKEICRRCPTELGEPVLVVYNQATAANPNMGVQNEIILLEAMSYVVRELAPDAADRCIRCLLGPISDRLQAGLMDPSTPEARIDHELLRLFAVVKPLELRQPLPPEQPHPVAAVLNETLWRILDQTLQRFSTNEKIVEKVCRVYKYTMRACGPSFAPYVQAMVEHLLRHFRTRPFPAYLYAASICASEFGKQLPQLMLELLVQFSTEVFKTLTDLPAYEQHPDLVEEYFFLVATFLEACPLVFMQTGQLIDHILTSGVHGLALNHREARSGIISCLQHFVGAALLNPARHEAALQLRAAVGELLVRHGQNLVGGLLGALMNPDKQWDLSVDDHRGNPVDVLWKFANVNPELLWSLLTTVTNSVDPQLANDEDKQRLLGNLSQALQSASKDAFFDTVARFTNAVARRTRRLIRQHQEQQAAAAGMVSS